MLKNKNIRKEKIKIKKQKTKENGVITTTILFVTPIHLYIERKKGGKNARKRNRKGTLEGKIRH